jgi:protein-S-isoprenylcysteine O-methyltransferase
LEYVIWPGSKGRYLFMIPGLMLVMGGQALRTAAMWTAASSFTHLVPNARREGQVLVTHGVFAHLRHPSYCGWFWWAVGTQLVLCNPLCTLAYAYVGWRFFFHRIPYEESLLVEFFGRDYTAYAARTYIGIPFIPNNVSISHQGATEGSTGGG